MLIEGPFSIKAPSHIDDYGWLECQLRLTHWAGGIVEAVAVYVDDSMNREDGFLAPLLRHVRWERSEDQRRAMTGELHWPTAVISLTPLSEHRAAVDSLIHEILSRATSLPVVPFGLSAERAVPEVDIDDRGKIAMFVSNGVQNIEFGAPTSGTDAGLSNLVLHGIAALRALNSPLALELGWRESYPYPLSADDIGGSHWWDYRVPDQFAPSA